MVKENLPKELFSKHEGVLGLQNPVVFESENDLFRDNKAPIDSAVIYLPKSKALIEMTLVLVSGFVRTEGKIVLVGSNDGGIRSAKDAYEKNLGPVEQKIVGNHSALYVGINKKLGAGKTWRDFLSFSPLSYKDVQIEAAELPGVFSAGELDLGTKLLLDNIPYDKKSVLDIGCGAGVIGALYKKKNLSSEVTMSDMSLLAVHATEETIKKNGLEAHVVQSDVFEKITGTYDLIVSNPPFHSGIETDYSFIEKFATGAKKRLVKGGEIYIVANSFLPYEKILEKYIGPTSIVIDTRKFKVIRTVAK